MTHNDIEELMERDPFLPFRIFITDGNTLDITRRMSMAVGRNGLFIILPDSRWKWVPLRQVASVETLEAAA